MCISMIRAAAPRASIHVVQVFERDGDDAPAERVLEGTKRALESEASVVCMPWTIAETQFAGEFKRLCSEAAGQGKVIVAAWAQEADLAVPASFESVVGVLKCRPASSKGPLVTWVESRGAAGTPFGASRGTAFVSGLAVVYAECTRRRSRKEFTEGLEAFAKEATFDLNLPDKPDGWLRFDFGCAVALTAAEYRRFISSQRD